MVIRKGWSVMRPNEPSIKNPTNTRIETDSKTLSDRCLYHVKKVHSMKKTIDKLVETQLPKKN